MQLQQALEHPPLVTGTQMLLLCPILFAFQCVNAASVTMNKLINVKEHTGGGN